MSLSMVKSFLSRMLTRTPVVNACLSILNEKLLWLLDVILGSEGVAGNLKSFEMRSPSSKAVVVYGVSASYL